MASSNMNDNIEFTHLLHDMYPAYNFPNDLHNSAIIKIKYFLLVNEMFPYYLREQSRTHLDE